MFWVVDHELGDGIVVAKRPDGFEKMTTRTLLNAKFSLRRSSVSKCSFCWERGVEMSDNMVEDQVPGSWTHGHVVSGSWGFGSIIGSGWRTNWPLSIKSVWGF